ncbi:M20/M25/M40 family metallo-hydrolase [Nocardia sp. NPDC052254]|uniref:M20/M25/M40 family metallo-hydrolase n=1 Tax=Nocardia sp. NPDC052254 TaxID=3155681 RepID=UPI00342316FE
MGSRVSGVVAFVLLLVVVVLTAWEQQPHGYRDTAAPTGEFSAERALGTVRDIAARPHPMGTAEHDRVRDRLAAQLRELGLDTDIRSGVGRWPGPPEGDSTNLGRTADIVARWPGTAATGTVYLVAHYDSVPNAPGANDDGVGVAAIVESIRALRASGERPRNDVVVLLTDGEEAGLLGAEAFAASGAADPRGGVAINLEARGAGGLPVLWRLTHPDGESIRVFAAVPHPNTDSLSTTLGGQQSTSGSDFTALEPTGLRVMDWAFTGRTAYYHNPFDDLDHVDPAVVQQYGDNTLAAAREFAARDLRTGSDASDSAYTSLPFGVLLVLPLWLIVVLAVVTVLLAGWVAWRMRRTGEVSYGRVFGAAATAVLSVPITIGAAYGVWQAITLIRPEYRELFVDPYRPQWYGAAILMVCVAVLAGWYALSRRWFGAPATAAGVLVAVALIGAVVTALTPPGAVLVVVAAFAAALGAALTFAVPDRWRLPVLTLFLLPAAVLLGVTAYPGLQAGLAGAYQLTAPVVAVLGLLFTLTLTHTWPQRRGVLVPATAVVVTVALAAVGLAVDRFDDRHPMTVRLSYALDADHQVAQWISPLEPNRWTRDFVSSTAPSGAFEGVVPDAVASGPAPVVQWPAPTVDVLSDRTESDHRALRLRLRSVRGAQSLQLRYPDGVTGLRVAGRDITPVPPHGFTFCAPPADGIDVELTVTPGPLSVRIGDNVWLGDAGVADTPPDGFYWQNGLAGVFTTITL